MRLSIPKLAVLSIAGLTAVKIGIMGEAALGAKSSAEEAAQHEQLAPPPAPDTAASAEELGSDDQEDDGLEADQQPADKDAEDAITTEDSDQSKGLHPELLVNIAKERDVLEVKRVALEAREAELELVEEALSRKMADLTALREELEQLLEHADKGHRDDLARLVRIYKAMKPSQAGAIMSDMDLEVATLVIAEMAEKDAGPILANMNMRRAQIISKIIYERSRLPGDQRPVLVPAGN